jgi:hypothetical protein
MGHCTPPRFKIRPRSCRTLPMPPTTCRTWNPWPPCHRDLRRERPMASSLASKHRVWGRSPFEGPLFISPRGQRRVGPPYIPKTRYDDAGICCRVTVSLESFSTHDSQTTCRSLRLVPRCPGHCRAPTVGRGWSSPSPGHQQQGLQCLLRW